MTSDTMGRLLSELREHLGILAENSNAPWDGDEDAWLNYFLGQVDDWEIQEARWGDDYVKVADRPGARNDPKKGKLTVKARKELIKGKAGKKAEKYGVKLGAHHKKECSMDAFKYNVQWFYRIKGAEWKGTKKQKLTRAIAISYSVLKSSCGITSKEKMTPSQMVQAGTKSEDFE